MRLSPFPYQLQVSGSASSGRVSGEVVAGIGDIEGVRIEKTAAWSPRLSQLVIAPRRLRARRVVCNICTAHLRGCVSARAMVALSPVGPMNGVLCAPMLHTALTAMRTSHTSSDLSSTPPGAVALTGATGMIGHALLAELLDRGIRCVALLRAPMASSLRHLLALLSEAGVDGEAAMRAKTLSVVEGDLTRENPPPAPWRVSALVHAAASTRFDETPSGELRRVNVGGTLRALRWGQSSGAKDVFLFSTAYVCGLIGDDVAQERIGWTAPTSNDYERTKRLAERLAARWARLAPGRSATILRPSIVVGDSQTGRSSRFPGFYMAVRATELLAAGEQWPDRQRLPLRLIGRATDPLDLVPVDYIAQMASGIIAHPSLRGAVYHLTHPSPPTNGQAQHAIEAHLGVAGGRFVSPESFGEARNEVERVFHAAQAPIRPYLINPPRFDRRNTSEAERTLGIRCPVWTPDRFDRLLTYATETRWRKRVSQECATQDDVASYFERYLPSRLGRRSLPGGDGVNTLVRFIVRGVPQGQWLCRFRDGRLASVVRGGRGVGENIRYEIERDSFWRVVAGEECSQDVFLRGDAEVGGDIEQALKLGVMLRLFNEMHPYSPEPIAPSAREGAA